MNYVDYARMSKVALVIEWCQMCDRSVEVDISTRKAKCECGHIVVLEVP